MNEETPPDAAAVKAAAAAFLRDEVPRQPVISSAVSGNENQAPGAGQAAIFTPQFIEQIKVEAVRETNAKLGFAATASITIAVFGLLLIGVIAVLGYKKTIQPSKLIALALIVISALLLIVLGYSDEQMSPVIGLLGTVAGYMLGSKEWDSDKLQKSDELPSTPSVKQPSPPFTSSATGA